MMCADDSEHDWTLPRSLHDAHWRQKIISRCEKCGQTDTRTAARWMQYLNYLFLRQINRRLSPARCTSITNQRIGE